MIKKAILIGGTGLVGGYLLDMLLHDASITQVVSIARKSCGVSHAKLTEVITPLTNPMGFRASLKGDILFCCLGSTLRQAGSKQKFFEIDHDIPLEIAKVAFQEGTPYVGLVSSIGANASSSNYYLQTKGQLEEDLKSLFGEGHVFIIRPSLLLGPRKPFRLGEKIGMALGKLISPILQGKLACYRPIHAREVAQRLLGMSRPKI